MLLKVVEINKKLLTFRKGRHFLEKKFQTTKFCDHVHNVNNLENQSENR